MLGMWAECRDLGRQRGRQRTFERFLRHSVHAFCVTWPTRRLGPAEACAWLGASGMAPPVASIRDCRGVSLAVDGGVFWRFQLSRLLELLLLSAGWECASILGLQNCL